MLDFIFKFARETAGVFADSAVYLLFGFAIAGLIYVFLPKDRVVRYFGGRTFRSVFNASLLGVPLPLCSCSVIPTAVALRRSGASRGSTLSFLISTPETGVDSIGISFALLDPLMAAFRPVAAFLTALVAGIGANLMERQQPVGKLAPAAADACADGCCSAETSQQDDCQDCHETTVRSERSSPRIRRAMRYAFGELMDDLAIWLVISFVAAGLIAVLIPDDFLANWAGLGIIPMFVMLLAGIPLYICATASTPIAAALILKGLDPGAALVFLLAGPATNIGSLILLSRYFERRYLALYLGTIAGMSIIFGLVLNGVYRILNLDVRAALGAASEIVPPWLEIAAAAVLLWLIHRSLARTRFYFRLARRIARPFRQAA